MRPGPHPFGLADKKSENLSIKKLASDYLPVIKHAIGPVNFQFCFRACSNPTMAKALLGESFIFSVL
jgi:hypothetical protein